MNTPLRALPLSRRTIIAAGLGVGALANAPALAAAGRDGPLPKSFAALAPLGARVRPISADEYRERMAAAQRLMGLGAADQQAIYVASGSTLRYLTGIRWGLSERLLALVLPRSGDPVIVVPAFEEG